MPYLSKERPQLSTKDILSWSFDEPQYDTSKPVSRPCLVWVFGSNEKSESSG